MGSPVQTFAPWVLAMWHQQQCCCQASWNPGQGDAVMSSSPLRHHITLHVWNGLDLEPEMQVNGRAPQCSLTTPKASVICMSSGDPSRQLDCHGGGSCPTHAMLLTSTACFYPCIKHLSGLKIFFSNKNIDHLACSKAILQPPKQSSPSSIHMHGYPDT